MPKWKSPLFSDIRNALEDNVVFSMWKGRPYFRTHVMPAQPRTPPQMAERAQMRIAIAQYRADVNTAPEKAAWDRIALPRLISGFNQYISQNRLSDIASPATATLIGGTVSITITYTLGIGAADARVYKEDTETAALSDITPTEGLRPDANQTFSYTETIPGTYRYWIADSRVLIDGDVPPQAYQRFCNEKPDHITGTAPRAETVVA